MTHHIVGNSCQVVEGMDVQPEYIQWHTDNSENNNTFTVPVPTGVSNTPDPYIVFCYYSPSTNHSVTVTATTSPTPESTGSPTSGSAGIYQKFRVNESHFVYNSLINNKFVLVFSIIYSFATAVLHTPM